MAISFANVIRFTAVSAGIASFVVASAPTGAVTPAQAAAIDGAVYPYYAQSADGSQWEYGSGAFTRATQTLARSTVTSTSNGDTNPVNFTSAPIVDVFQAPAQGLQQSGKTVVLDSDTAMFTNGDIYCKDNPWNKGALVRGVDYEERIHIVPGTFPNQVMMEWTWPTGSGIGGLYSYPLLGKDFTGTKAISSYSNISTTFDYTIDFNGNDPNNPTTLPFDVLHEIWLYDPDNVEVMMMATPRRSLPRTEPVPFVPITATILGVPVTFDVEVTLSGWKKLTCYPTTHQRGPSDNKALNSTLSGAVAGTPGTDPTDCIFNVGSTGLTKTIGGSGTATAADGSTVNYTDVQIHGTPTATGSVYFQFYVDGGPYVKTPPNQDWIVSTYLAIEAGSVANIAYTEVGATLLDSTPAFLFSAASSDLTAALTSSLQNFACQIFSPSQQAPSMALVAPFVFMGVTSGQAVNITLRIASPVAAWDNKRIISRGRFDWKALFTALTAAGILTGSEWLNSIQFGAETNGGTGSLSIQSYSVDVS